MTIGPIVPNTVGGVTGQPTGKAVEATVPTSATGDSTDRDADGRQVLDVFEKTSDEDEPAPEPEPTPEVDGDERADDGHLDFLA